MLSMAAPTKRFEIFDSVVVTDFIDMVNNQELQGTASLAVRLPESPINLDSTFPNGVSIATITSRQFGFFGYPSIMTFPTTRSWQSTNLANVSFAPRELVATEFAGKRPYGKFVVGHMALWGWCSYRGNILADSNGRRKVK